MNDQLEGLVDQTSLTQVCEALAEVCRDKAEHLRTNWQDDATAKAWEHAAKTIETAATRIKV